MIVILFVIVFSFAGYKFLSSKTTSSAGLKVVSTPQTSVFLNDKLVGKTPLDDKYPPGEYTLKLIPQDTSTQYSSWQGKITLSPSFLTYVNRELGSSELTSAGEILSLEKISGSQSQVAVFSTPDAASVLFDGQEKGATPLLLRDVLPGEHDVAISSAGFVGRTIRIQATAGYKLAVEFQLALAATNEPSPTITSTPTESGKSETTKPYVLIKDTPTGFLRVRSSSSTSATEVSQVKPGEKYPLLESKEGWFKISYSEGKEGWISSRYAEKVE